MRRLAGALEGGGVLSAEMRRAGWRDAHHLVHDERIYEDRAFVFFRWLHQPLTEAEAPEAWMLSVARQGSPGLALLAAAIFEVPATSPVVVALERLSRAAVATKAGLTARELEAWQLRAGGSSWYEVACSMLVSKAAAREYVRRADTKIEAARRRLDGRRSGLSHSQPKVVACS